MAWPWQYKHLFINNCPVLNRIHRHEYMFDIYILFSAFMLWFHGKIIACKQFIILNDSILC